MKNCITPVSIEEHKALIRTLSPHEYVYLFDARVRTAITFSPVGHMFYVCVCAPSGDWMIIDSFKDVKSVVPAFDACAKAVYSSTYQQFAHDMEYFGKVAKRSEDV